MKTPPPTRFEAESYRRHRPRYPDSLFYELRTRLGLLHILNPRSVLDLGCGAGQSFESFLNAYASLESGTFVDPDLAMLEECRTLFSRLSFRQTYLNSKAEDATIGDSSFDAILIGSAFHWMKTDELIKTIRSHLAPKGFLFIFEYQFPRSLDLAPLNDWIRKKFNSEWKAPNQTPRGSFRDLVKPLDSVFRRVPFHAPEWKPNLSLEELLGHLFSQSRYLHSETGLSPDAVATQRAQIENELRSLWGEDHTHAFNLYLDAALFCSL